MIPEDGDASGRSATCLEIAEFRGFKLSGRMFWKCGTMLSCGDPVLGNSNPLGPKAWGTKQISLSLTTPAGQRLCALRVGNVETADKVSTRASRRFDMASTPFHRVQTEADILSI